MRVWLLALLMSVATASVAAPKDYQSRVRANFAPPATILANADRLGLSDTEKARLRSLIVAAELDVERLQARLESATDALVRILEARPGHRQDVVDALRRVQKVDGEIKERHLTLWIESNAILTRAQREKAIAMAGTPKPAT